MMCEWNIDMLINFFFLCVTGSLYVSLFSGRGHHHSFSTYSGVPIVIFVHPYSSVDVDHATTWS